MITQIKTIDDLKVYCKQLRAFDVDLVLAEKIKAINTFFLENDLDSCTLGLSGGADSTLVLNLLLKAAKENNSPIKKVVGCFMPIYSKGITGQDKAQVYVQEMNNSIGLKEKIKYQYLKLDLTSASKAYSTVLGVYDPWTIGQIDSIVRTPALYGIAAKLQKDGFNSIVVGTTNRDEGSYIGFYGKQSDGANDLQPIADLHKSEVYALLKKLNAPHCIIDREPEGDVFDNRTDEQMIGAPYWFLEIYQILIENKATYLLSYIKDYPVIQEWALNIESLHMKNAHKYKVGTTAHYIDVMPRKLNF